MVGSAAVFIDAENISSRFISSLVVLSEHCKVKNAYGDWTSKNLQSWTAALETTTVTRVQVSKSSGLKNAADIAITADAVALTLTDASIRKVYLVSDDSDFLPLIERLQQVQIEVIGIGTAQASEIYRRRFDTYIDLTKSLQVPEEIREHFIALAQELSRSRKWIELSQLAEKSEQIFLKTKRYTELGYSKFISFIRDLHIFEFKQQRFGYLVRLLKKYRKILHDSTRFLTEPSEKKPALTRRNFSEAKEMLADEVSRVLNAASLEDELRLSDLCQYLMSLGEKFDYRAYGFRKFSRFIQALGCCAVYTSASSTSNEMLVMKLA